MTVFWILLAVVAFLLLNAAVVLIITLPITRDVFNDTLVRTSPEKWGRTCSAPEISDHLDMFNKGVEWGDSHRDCLRAVEVENDGLKLRGEYFDLGFDRCVVILSGRSESVKYCYFFAPPYEKAGYNVLVFDSRAHGLSEGKYNCVGIKEYRDLIKWIELAHSLGNSEVVLHGVCIGGSTAIFAATDPSCPEYVTRLTVEGLFTSFYESFAEHTRRKGKPAFPVAQQMRLLCKRRLGIDIKKFAPERCIDRLKLPILMLHGKEDIFSVPDKAQELFDKCGSTDKTLLWFEHGTHSHLRYFNTESYDRAVMDFNK